MGLFLTRHHLKKAAPEGQIRHELRTLVYLREKLWGERESMRAIPTTAKSAFRRGSAQSKSMRIARESSACGWAGKKITDNNALCVRGMHAVWQHAKRIPAFAATTDFAHGISRLIASIFLFLSWIILLQAIGPSFVSCHDPRHWLRINCWSCFVAIEFVDEVP
jgi:hypothetical protein